MSFAAAEYYLTNFLATSLYIYCQMLKCSYKLCKLPPTRTSVSCPKQKWRFLFIRSPRGWILFARGARIVPFIEFVPTFALILFSVLNNCVLSSKIHFGCRMWARGLMMLVSDSSVGRSVKTKSRRKRNLMLAFYLDVLLKFSVS